MENHNNIVPSKIRLEGSGTLVALPTLPMVSVLACMLPAASVVAIPSMDTEPLPMMLPRCGVPLITSKRVPLANEMSGELPQVAAVECERTLVYGRITGEGVVLREH